MLEIQEFEIRGIFGRANVRIPIRDNKVIIVGYNGSGKSTTLNALYYLITSQWFKLDDIIFDEIVLTSSKSEFKITKSELSTFCRRSVPPRYRVSNRYLRQFADWSASDLSRFAGASTREAREALRSRSLVNPSTPLVRDLQLSVRELLDFGDEEDEENSKNIKEIDGMLEKQLDGRILYLPTYRRIEKDIKAVFPEIESELQDAIRKRSRSSSRTDVFVELVNFGMEDVKSIVDSKLENLRIQALSEVNSLTTRYLRDVIRNEARSYSDDLARAVNQDRLHSLFQKMDESMLNADDRNNIDKVVEKIKTNANLAHNEQYVAHYVSYLIEIAERISRFEAPVQQFADLCNSYLFGKYFVFDNAKYEFYIRYISEMLHSEEGDEESFINMEDLSSGEKQIVSLFCHLTLGQELANYIIIDEPELSLSVDWQQRFLPDIANSDGCVFLGAVTHSPFVFDNELEQYAVDILEHTREA